MNPVARFEHACSRWVEDAFARVFPSDLDPAQVGRKLAARMQADRGDLYLVRVHPSDYARFAADRDFLEARWSALLREALPSERRESAPRALLHEDSRIVAGSVAIETVSDERVPPLVLVWGDGRRVILRDGLCIGRARDNDVVLTDARASRRHAKIEAAGGAYAIVDLGSSNGTFIDGRRVERALLEPDATVAIGSTLLRVGRDAG